MIHAEEPPSMPLPHRIRPPSAIWQISKGWSTNEHQAVRCDVCQVPAKPPFRGGRKGLVGPHGNTLRYFSRRRSRQSVKTQQVPRHMANVNKSTTIVPNLDRERRPTFDFWRDPILCNGYKRATVSPTQRSGPTCQSTFHKTFRLCTALYKQWALYPI